MSTTPPDDAELLCERCGGLKRMEVTIAFEECVPHELRFHPQHIPAGYHLCPGHPTEPEHNGQLNARGDTRVSLDSTVPFESGCVHLENDWSDGISLVADEALSLLAWLKQREPALKQLVKEQDLRREEPGQGEKKELARLPEREHRYFFHADGLYFTRHDGGSVTITRTDGAPPAEGGKVLFEQHIIPGSWVSLVLTMSAFNERPGDFHAWMRHHTGEEDLLAGKRGGW